MKKLILALALSGALAVPATATTVETIWSAQQLDQLRTAIDSARAEGVDFVHPQPVSAATATAAALGLARAHLFGQATVPGRSAWRIASDDDRYDLPLLLSEALSRDEIPQFFDRLRPRHSDYHALLASYRTETDATRRATLRLNLERWRWMPLELGSRYLLVNAPQFELGLWENGRQTRNWRIIVGKPTTPTPIFSATVTGVTYNPWWDVPQSIVRESVGSLTRRSPALARRRGFVWGNGSYRQRPGPNNPLGQMKLAMPNPYSVYLHDTNAKTLFERPVRAFSHGCVRVDNALDLAATVLGTDRLAETGGQTVTLPASEPIPVYIAYFTASAGQMGQVLFHPDIYGRDVRLSQANDVPQDRPT